MGDDTLKIGGRLPLPQTGGTYVETPPITVHKSICNRVHFWCRCCRRVSLLIVWAVRFGPVRQHGHLCCGLDIFYEGNWFLSRQ